MQPVGVTASIGLDCVDPPDERVVDLVTTGDAPAGEDVAVFDTILELQDPPVVSATPKAVNGHRVEAYEVQKIRHLRGVDLAAHRTDRGRAERDVDEPGCGGLPLGVPGRDPPPRWSRT